MRWWRRCWRRMWRRRGIEREGIQGGGMRAGRYEDVLLAVTAGVFRLLLCRSCREVNMAGYKGQAFKRFRGDFLGAEGWCRSKTTCTVVEVGILDLGDASSLGFQTMPVVLTRLMLINSWRKRLTSPATRMHLHIANITNAFSSSSTSASAPGLTGSAQVTALRRELWLVPMAE